MTAGTALETMVYGTKWQYVIEDILWGFIKVLGYDVEILQHPTITKRIILEP